MVAATASRPATHWTAGTKVVHRTTHRIRHGRDVPVSAAERLVRENDTTSSSARSGRLDHARWIASAECESTTVDCRGRTNATARTGAIDFAAAGLSAVLSLAPS